MILLQLFIQKTKSGRAMRAVSENQDAAVLMGIDVNRTISLTFIIGSALGALGASSTVQPMSRLHPLWEHFLA